MEGGKAVWKCLRDLFRNDFSSTDNFSRGNLERGKETSGECLRALFRENFPGGEGNNFHGVMCGTRGHPRCVSGFPFRITITIWAPRLTHKTDGQLLIVYILLTAS